jgi:hypothetical protein
MMRFLSASSAVKRVLFSFAVALTLAAFAPAQSAPTFYHDVVPILQDHCQSCHRAGEIAPFALETYRQAKGWAAAIAADVKDRKMPPWFADACCGKFSNDWSLSAQQIRAPRRLRRAGPQRGTSRVRISC